MRDIAQRLIAKVDVVETALAQEHGVQPAHFARDFQWEVNVIPSEQANAFCLPGGKMAVYTGLVPVARTRRDNGGDGPRDCPCAAAPRCAADGAAS